MLDEIKKFQKGNWKDVDDKLLFPLMKYASGNEKNFTEINNINKYIFVVPPKISKYMMRRLTWWSKTPKRKEKEEDSKQMEVIKPILLQYFKWSEREFNENNLIINNLINDIDFKKWVSKLAGLNEKENKIIGIEEEKNERTTKSLFAF